MSFQNNSIWLPNGSGSVADREMCYETSTRIDQKRPHRMFMDSSEQEQFHSKKQAVEPFKRTSGIAVLESSLWHDGSHFQSESQTPSLFNPKPVRSSNEICPVTASKNMENKDPGNQFGNDPSTCLTMSHAVNCSLSLNSGTRKVKVNEAFNRRNYNIHALGEQYVKENGNFSSICPTYNRGQENLFALDPFYRKGKEAFMSAGPNKGERHIAFHGQQDATIASLGALYFKEDSSILSMVEHSAKGKETAIYFGGFQNNVEERDHSGRLISSYDVLLNQSSAQSSGALGQRDSMDQLSANAILASSSRADGGAPKNKDQKTKKGSSNDFPSNVKSLLSTGILDGVPVKYVSWSREKSLRAVVKGTGYLCSCQNCKLSKIVNAYEFERHAGCKTKHPNNHIYFENGKTIYAVVQELKSTPQEMLFDVIQNMTGSAVNQKNFNTWKASYEIATRELERIFGKDDLVAPS